MSHPIPEAMGEAIAVVGGSSLTSRSNGVIQPGSNTAREINFDQRTVSLTDVKAFPEFGRAAGAQM